MLLLLVAARVVVDAGGDVDVIDVSDAIDDGVGVGWAKMVAEGGGLRIASVQNRALGDNDIERPDHALVVGDVGIDHLQQRQQRRRSA